MADRIVLGREINWWKSTDLCWRCSDKCTQITS